MKGYLAYFLKNIFEIFNCELDITEDDILVKRDKSTKAHEFSPSDGFTLVYSQFYYNNPKINTVMPDSFYHMGRYCLKAFQRHLGIYPKKETDRHAIYTLINKIIETSLVSAILKVKKIKDTDIASLSAKTKLNLIDVLEGLLSALNKWANRTYEGRKVPFSILIDYTNEHCSNNISKIVSFLEDDASALLTDGLTSYFKAGNKLEYKTVELINIEQYSGDKQPLVPYRFSSFAHVCGENQIGIILTVQGDIIIIKGEKILFAKRNGEWHSYDYEMFRKNVADKIKDNLHYKKADQLFREVYLSSLDVAFARTGGCIAVCFPNMKQEVLGCINPEDIHKPYRESNTKISLKREVLEETIVGKNVFYQLKRKARQEMLGIDGVTILSNDGKMITTGAIINNDFEDSSDEKDIRGGARTRVTRKLSQYGLAIKISADGYIECYQNTDRIY